MEFTVKFFDQNDILFDPASGIQITVSEPAESGGTTTTYAYPAQLNKRSTGTYFIIIEATRRGYWSGQGKGTLPNGMDVTTPKTLKQVV